LVKEKVKEVILIGEAKSLIGNAISGCAKITEAPSLEVAVKTAFQSAASGDTVLFSPMCSSFDMFTNYEERGRAFKKIVLGLK
jgi:UDP-N-acetylmuramoylalanine--D-glutamate ligase